ncbi:MFS-type transporter SLC18B1-like isoform X2 [Centruroides sculpturatus]|nr:MFS-type transporter SLC18B1-like isoform X2 [Centruroides sculpturatus]XP_023235570.1 MFS-type transporter SLC18B1-like isoform X2 [Centruroides sculpturatus]XP_023235578.1 MFS-type transporter SLC18B1-like isoform X2 [Centruroides sculpturatus]XP_023235584.1 MFS-type transporter SLC18B1-like isoform X2 [Centruroides sculpturatus]
MTEQTSVNINDEHVRKKRKSRNGIKSVLKGITRNQILLLIAFGYCNFAMGACYALLAPFFPREAEYKGASPTIYGLIIGFYQLIVIVVSPICGKMSSRVSPNLLAYGGIFLSGSASILFGILEWSPPGITFIILAFLIRMFDAMGWAAYFTSSYAIVAMNFSEKRATVLSIVETIFGLGMIMGPTIGGALYQVGGYAIPFVTMGCILLVGSFTSFLIIPPCGELPPENPGNLIKLLKNPTYIIDLTVCVSCFFALGFNDATLEPHLREFGLSPVLLGTVFIILGGIYALGSPIWGYLCDTIGHVQILCAVGIFLSMIGFLFIGPVPFIPLPTTLWLVIVAQVFLGLGMGGKLICAFLHAMIEAIETGLPDDVSTYSIVFGTLTSACSLGSFIGPSLGGFLLDHVGYKYATVYVAGIELGIGIIVGTFAIWKKFRHKTGEEIFLLKE